MVEKMQNFHPDEDFSKGYHLIDVLYDTDNRKNCKDCRKFLMKLHLNPTIELPILGPQHAGDDQSRDKIIDRLHGRRFTMAIYRRAPELTWIDKDQSVRYRTYIVR